MLVFRKRKYEEIVGIRAPEWVWTYDGQEVSTQYDFRTHEITYRVGKYAVRKEMCDEA